MQARYEIDYLSIQMRGSVEVKVGLIHAESAMLAILVLSSEASLFPVFSFKDEEYDFFLSPRKSFSFDDRLQQQVHMRSMTYSTRQDARMTTAIQVVTCPGKCIQTIISDKLWRD